MPLEGGMRADTWKTLVTINDIDFGIWDQFEGGEVDSDEVQYKPGGMAEPVSLGGTRTVGNFTIRRLYKLGRDHIESGRLIDWVGKVTVVAKRQPLDHDGNTWGKPITYRGTLKTVTFPNTDSTANDAALLEIVCTPDGYPVGMPRP